jgi:hypothetical protein
MMATDAAKQPLDDKTLIEKIAKQKHVSKGNGEKRKPFERIVL